MPDTRLDLFIGESGKAFEAENDRRDKLTEKAEKLLTAVGVVAGFQLVDLKDLPRTGSAWNDVGLALALASLAALGAAFVFALLGIRVRDYKGYPSKDNFIDALERAESDDDAKSRVANTYLASREANALINDARARRLSASGYFLIAGFAAAVASQLIVRLLK